MNLPLFFPRRPPVWAESRLGLEAAALLRSRVLRGIDVEDGGGQPVMLVPGFLAGDNSLGVLTGWLRRTGHRTKSAGMRFNVDCSGTAFDRLEERLECVAESTGRRVALIGQSRGGTFTRALAVRRPDLISGIVNLGSPVLNPLATNVFVKAGILMVGTLGTLGAPGFFTYRCREGECCDPFWRAVAEPFPDHVGYVSIYSRSDGVIDYRACLDPAARCAEINSTHVGMSLNARAYRSIAAALADFRRAEQAGSEPVRAAA